MLQHSTLCSPPLPHRYFVTRFCAQSPLAPLTRALLRHALPHKWDEQAAAVQAAAAQAEAEAAAQAAVADAERQRREAAEEAERRRREEAEAAQRQREAEALARSLLEEEQRQEAKKVR